MRILGKNTSLGSCVRILFRMVFSWLIGTNVGAKFPCLASSRSDFNKFNWFNAIHNELWVTWNKAWIRSIKVLSLKWFSTLSCNVVKISFNSVLVRRRSEARSTIAALFITTFLLVTFTIWRVCPRELRKASVVWWRVLRFRWANFQLASLGVPNSPLIIGLRNPNIARFSRPGCSVGGLDMDSSKSKYSSSDSVSCPPSLLSPICAPASSSLSPSSSTTPHTSSSPVLRGVKKLVAIVL